MSSNIEGKKTFARIVAFVISQPEEIDVNEILFRPTHQELKSCPQHRSFE